MQRPVPSAGDAVLNTSVSHDPMDFSFSIAKSDYRHISLTVDGDEATIVLDVDPKGGLRDDCQLKLNSYDLSVDIELANAINRLRFEYPHVRVVTITSGNGQIFSAGANIYMLKKSSHAFKVNFCKFTNETRLYIEEASRFSGKRFLCALNGTAAGGGYELAMACDRIALIDDRAANVSLPEVPLLGVLPGTGGLTRLTDKRKVRRDLADVFCTIAEGVKGQRAKDWHLVDEIYAKSSWEQGIKAEIAALKNQQNAITQGEGITLTPIVATLEKDGFSYRHVAVEIRGDRTIRITIAGLCEEESDEPSSMLRKGEDLWVLRAFRELDDALLRLRFFYPDHGLLEFVTIGDKELLLRAEKPLYRALDPDAHWFSREILLHMGRVFRRLDLMSRTSVAVILPDSAFAGCLAELLFACDRSYALKDDMERSSIHLSPLNSGLLSTWSGPSRLALRFYGREQSLSKAYERTDGSSISLSDAEGLGLITFLLDEIDFQDELRIYEEERASLSPDALSAMEANLRCAGPESMASKIFGRLSAFQNWVFIRNNASGPKGALTSYGEDRQPVFDWHRC